MASLRNQPYIALYIQDFLTDERLMVCSASAVGVYIKIMCVLTKQQEYGVFLLREYEKKSVDQLTNFATKFNKFLPFGIDIITEALNELVTEGVLIIDGDKIYQKRMVKDSDISEKRSQSGKKGGLTAQEKKRSGGDPCMSPDDVEVIVTEGHESVKSEVINALVEDFGLKEHKFANHQKTVMQFVNLLAHNGDLMNFIDQYKAYKLYKSESGEQMFAWKTLIGAGGKEATWNDRNWTAELDRIRSNNNKPAAESKTQTAASTFGGIKK